MLPIPNAPVVRKVFPDDYIDVGNGFRSSEKDKSTVSKASSYKSKDQCDQENLIHVAINTNINELVDCTPLGSESVSIKAVVPINATKAQLSDAINYARDSLLAQLNDTLEVVSP